MTSTNNPKRRTLMMALSGLTLSSAADAAPPVASSKEDQPHTLVVFFTRSGNTRVIAELLQRTLGSSIIEIHPATPYPADYLQTVDRATRERDNNIEPQLACSVGNLSQFDAIYLAFPIWGETVPAVIRTFLATHDLAGKRLIPIVTHGGYGLGNSMEVLKKYAPKARLETGFTMEADQERRTMNQVLGWLKQHEAAS
jgi:hypothetical protein